ncbi:MAG: hypothetical protein ACOVOR_02325 [Rhabdochlamydiaceae bacterium]
MKKTIYTFFCTLCVLFPSLMRGNENLRSYLTHKYERYYIQEINQLNVKINDLVAVLSDGSEWRIDREDHEKLCKWEKGDEVHLDFRITTDWYILERKHFYLFNHKKDELVEVFLLKTPLSITYAQPPNLVSFLYDQYGRKFNFRYRQNILLSNQSAWEMDDSPASNTIRANTPAYLGYTIQKGKTAFGFSYRLKDKDEYTTPFLITMDGEPLNFYFVREGHYNYRFL